MPSTGSSATMRCTPPRQWHSRANIWTRTVSCPVCYTLQEYDLPATRSVLPALWCAIYQKKGSPIVKGKGSLTVLLILLLWLSPGAHADEKPQTLEALLS